MNKVTSKYDHPVDFSAHEFEKGDIIRRVAGGSPVKPGQFRIVTDNGIVALDTGTFTPFAMLTESRYVQITDPVTIEKEKGLPA